MAEGFARSLLGPDWTVASAGLETHGLNPRAVAVMKEVGIDISDQESTLINPDYLASSDLVVTLCGDARDRCPVVPVTVTRLHWNLPDPAAATGSDDDIMAAFRSVRDDISRRIRSTLAEQNTRSAGEFAR